MDHATPPAYSHALASTVARECRRPAFSHDFGIKCRCWLYDEDGDLVEAIPDEGKPGERPGYHGFLHDRLRTLFGWDGALGPFECFGSYHAGLSYPPQLPAARDLTTILAALGIPYTRLNYETLLRMSSFLDDDALPGWSQFVRVGETYEHPDLRQAEE